ncbi:hypothetical protein VZQ01_29205 [Myxococcus faecalis]|uniref:hypothetical protein n=1 Tax=Myxococcus faecalis TaxID=3115646 RepID=UPI0024CA89EE|nr:hypothetical protein MFMH1_66130 [Myxococcus sp. MH1]
MNQGRPVVSSEPALDDVAHARESGAVLWDAPGTLSTSDRESLRPWDVEGLSAEEAARPSGIDAPAHKRRLHRAHAPAGAALQRVCCQGLSKRGGPRAPWRPGAHPRPPPQEQ